MRRRIGAWFGNKASIEKRLMMTNLYVLIVPMLLLSMMFIFVLGRTSREETNRLRLSGLSQRNAGFVNMTSDMTAVTNTLYHDMEINQLLSRDYQGNGYGLITAIAQCRQAVAVSRNIIPNKDYDLVLLGANGVNTSEGGLNEGKLIHEPWYGRMKASRGELLYISGYDAPMLTNAFPETKAFAVRKMVNLISGRYLGVMIVKIGSELFEENLRRGIVPEKEHILVLDEAGHVIYSDIDVGNTIDWASSIYFEDISNQYTGVTMDRRSQRIVTHTANEQNGWYLVSCEHASFTLARSSMLACIVVLICLGLSMLMSRYNAKYIHRRTQTVVDALQEVVDGNLHARLEASPDKEFAEITTHFNAMLDRIEGLLEQVEAESREKMRHEMDALRSQINPHFLNNTIASIRYLILDEKLNEADRALVGLVRLLRATFTEKREIISIQEELALLQDYVQIMEIRYEDSFEFAMEVQDGLAQRGILMWTLQPFVENSISHGFNQKREMGHIRVKAQEEDGNTVLYIEDDGINGDLERIQRALSFGAAASGESRMDGRFNGIGIRNVQSRIKKRFGQEYGITARKNEAGGITFRILIPAVPVEGEQNENSSGR